MSIITVKFGGSSLANAEQFRKVKDIIKADPNRRYIVPSAPGKRFADDIKITDMLIKCNELAINGNDFSQEWTMIRDRYDEIIIDLGLAISLEDEYTQIQQNIANRMGKDYAASRGEYLCGMILAEFLDTEFIDAADVIEFKSDGRVDMDATYQKIRDNIKSTTSAVIPGFYGSNQKGNIVTFSRGGSDVSGSLVAAATKSFVYENWTDVSGFLVADPRIVVNPRVIEMITYKELRELSYMGATVLHEDSIFPVRTSGIPINIRNTNDTSAKGTLIVSDSESKDSKFTITGIAGKKGFTNFYIDKAHMNNELGFCRRVLQVFEENGVTIEHMPSGIDTLSVIVSSESIHGKKHKIMRELDITVRPDNLIAEDDLALLAVVGRGMKNTRGTAGRIFSMLAHKNINIRMIDQGSSELNIIIGVTDSDLEKSIRAIYNAFEV